MNPAQSPHIQEGAESILDHANPSRPTEPVNLTFWQTCKAHPWPAAAALLVVLGLAAVVLGACVPKKPYESVLETQTSAAIVQLATPEFAQTAETPIQPQFIPKNTPKKIARQAINTPASGANLAVSDDASTDILGDFIAQIEREKAQKPPVNAVPAPSASNLEQDFETRLFNFERKIP